MASKPATKESLQPRIIDALSYPRTVLRSCIEIESCPHDGVYDGQDGKCRTCHQWEQCEWLYSNEAFLALDKKPFPVILTALRDASEFLDAQVRLQEHNSRRCPCSSCAWLRDAQRLLDKARAL